MRHRFKVGTIVNVKLPDPIANNLSDMAIITVANGTLNGWPYRVRVFEKGHPTNIGVMEDEISIVTDEYQLMLFRLMYQTGVDYE